MKDRRRWQLLCIYKQWKEDEDVMRRQRYLIEVDSKRAFTKISLSIPLPHYHYIERSRALEIEPTIHYYL
jgi:hypothetical protein